MNSSCSKVVPSRQPLSDWQKIGLKLTSSQQGRDVVLAIDLTGSVRLNDEGRLRLKQIIQDSLRPGDTVYVVPFASTVNPLQPQVDCLSANAAITFDGKPADVDSAKPTLHERILQTLPLKSSNAQQNTDIQIAEATIYKGLAQLNQCRLTTNKSIRSQSVVWLTDAPLRTKPGIDSATWVETPANSPFRQQNSSESRERQEWLNALPLQMRSQKIGNYNLSVVDIAPTVQEFCTPAPGGQETCLINGYLALVPKKMIDQISCLKCLKTKGLSSHPSLTVQCQLMERGLIVEPGLNIFVVGSLCGGTGSGMFLDVAYSLRQAYGDIENQLIGYWIVSPELYGNTPSMNANTYAALKELNHYAAANTRFQACYDPQQLVNINSDRPPFDFTYIVSNKTASDYKINDKDKLCNVIAHKIFLDFGDELTTVIKSQKDNFKDKLTRLDNHPRRNVQRYLTFGLAKIYVPQDRIIQIALNKIRQRLISFWVRGIGQNPDPQILLDRFLLKCGTSAADRALPHRLQLSVTDNKKTFSQALKIWSTKIEQEISTVKNATDRQQLLSQLATGCRAQFRKVQPGETDDIRGMWLTQLQKVMPELRSTLGQEVFTFLEELLSPSSQDFCFNNARSWLEAIITVINQEQRYLEEYLQAKN